MSFAGNMGFLSKAAVLLGVVALGLGAACSGKGGRPGDGQNAASGDSLVLSISLSAGSFAVGEKIGVRLVARNLTGREIGLFFPTAQRYELVVRRGQGVVWQSSADMMFAQVVGRETIAPGDSLVFETALDQAAIVGTNPELGAYTIQGVLKARPEISTEAKQFGIVD